MLPDCTDSNVKKDNFFIEYDMFFSFLYLNVCDESLY